MREAARLPARLLALGLPLGPLRLLRTRGRRSGRTHVVPVVVLRHRGRTWLVSPFGDTAWVHNARAHARAELEHLRRQRAVDLVEVTGAERLAVLRRYRRRFAAIGYVRTAFATTPLHDDGAMAHLAARHPVFAVRSASTVRTARTVQTAPGSPA